MKDEFKKFRYFIKVDHNMEYRVFETRYYAEKWLYEIYLNKNIDSDSFQRYKKDNFLYEIKKADEGFVIYKIWQEML